MADEVYTPIVTLEEQDVDSGERDESCVFKQRAKLYRFNEDLGEWRDRGVGEAKLMQHLEMKTVRFIMRQEKTLKVIGNHIVDPSMELTPNAGSDTSFCWVAQDYAEGDMEVEQFAIRFKTPEDATEFKAKYDEVREINAAALKGSGAEVLEGVEETEAAPVEEAPEEATEEAVVEKEAETADKQEPEEQLDPVPVDSTNPDATE